VKTCIACGMPMQSAEDYPGGNTQLDYCVHCARPDGSMCSYDEALEGMTQFMVRTQGLDESVTRGVAADMMAKLPAWQ
jgi:hypothetical protein